MRYALPLAALAFGLFFSPLIAAGESTSPHDTPAFFELQDAPVITIDWSKGTSQAVQLGGNRKLLFTGGQKGGRYILILKQDATGSRTVDWPQNVRWPGVNPPTLTTLANKTDHVFFLYNGLDGKYDMLGTAQNY